MDRQKVLQVIEALESIDPHQEFSYEEAIRTFLLLDKIPVLIDKVDSNTSICRTRIHSNNESLFEKISDIFIAPKM